MPLIHETDHGTPISLGANQVTLSVDGHDVTVPEGTSIMRAAVAAGIKTPELCAIDSLNSFGSCRLCPVEIEGRPGTPASCTTLAAPGMRMHTTGEKVRRRDVRYGYDGANHLDSQVDASNPYFQFDPAKCIVCSRCARACEEVQGTFALNIQSRGFPPRCQQRWTSRS
jgi:formate dehydrogenase major subunit